MLSLFLLTLLLLMQRKVCISVQEVHWEDLAGRSGDHSCNFIAHQAPIFSTSPSCQGAAATFQHPGKKCQQWQLVKATDRTETSLVTVFFMPYLHASNSCWCISCFRRKISVAASCVCLYTPDQAIASNVSETISYWDTCLYTTNKVMKQFMAESL